MKTKICGCGNASCNELISVLPEVADDLAKHPDQHLIADSCTTKPRKGKKVATGSGYKIYSYQTVKPVLILEGE